MTTTTFIPGKLYRIILGSGTFVSKLSDVTLLNYDIKSHFFAGGTSCPTSDVVMHVCAIKSWAVKNAFMADNKIFVFYHSYIERTLVLL